MADQILFDKLIYIDRLKRAGVTEDQARAHAEAIDGALREAVATKTDIVVLKAEIKAELKFQQWQLTIIAAMILGILAKLFYR